MSSVCKTTTTTKKLSTTATPLMTLMLMAMVIAMFTLPACSNNATDSAAHSGNDEAQNETMAMNQQATSEQDGSTNPETMEEPTMPATFFDLSATSITGEPVDFDQYKGNVVVVVNTASRCGFTPQYEDLQALYETHADRGLVILGFPSNDFLGQEPGTNEEILTFCQTEFGVTFPMMSKIRVKSGDDQSPVYTWLESKTGETPGWNFGKYIVSPDGKEIQFFGTRTNPKDDNFMSAIEAQLAKVDARAENRG